MTDPEARKSETVIVRMTPETYAQLLRLAGAAEMSMSKWVRAAIRSAYRRLHRA